MQDDNKGSRINWGSLIGWAIFVLLIAGPALSRLFGRLVGQALPVNITNLVPLLFGALVVLSLVVAAVRALSGSSRPPGSAPSNRPMPPFGGPAFPLQPPPAPSPRSFAPRTPRFEPIVDPKILAIGIVGALVLGGAAALFVAMSAP